MLQDKPQADRTRVGGATDDLLSEGGIGATIITASTKEGGNTAARNLSRLQMLNNTERTLQQAYSQINTISDKLGLNRTILDTAQHYYKLVYEKKSARGRGLAAVAAAVLLCACQQEGVPRTVMVHAFFAVTEPAHVNSHTSLRQVSRCAGHVRMQGAAAQCLDVCCSMSRHSIGNTCH